MKSRLYIYLCEDARSVRGSAKPDEQNFSDDPDDTDGSSLHVVVYSDSGEPIGTGCLFSPRPGSYSIGSIAVADAAKGSGIKIYIIQRLLTECVKCGANEITLWAREYAVPFYERLGFESSGDIKEDNGILQFKMLRYI